ncbi:MAG TPA: hypothetical protein VFZ59_26375 [Verrucomicrobiae bacterium]|nr:hypothetical protein [Verrucomicrobiae bacterium]
MKSRLLLMFYLVLSCSPVQVVIGAEQWPNFDIRRIQEPTGQPDLSPLARVKAQIPGLEIDHDSLLGGPKFIRSRTGFLREAEQIYDPTKSPPLPHGAPSLPKTDRSDPYRTLKRFVDENSDMFGYDSSVLATARVRREYVAQHNRLRTVVWQQELEGIPVFEAVLIANFTRSDALVSLSSQAVPDLSRAVRVNVALLSAVDALALAARNIGEEQTVASDFVANGEPRDPETTITFTPPAWTAFTTITLTNGVGSFQFSPTNAQSFFRALTD